MKYSLCFSLVGDTCYYIFPFQCKSLKIVYENYLYNLWLQYFLAICSEAVFSHGVQKVVFDVITLQKNCSYSFYLFSFFWKLKNVDTCLLQGLDHIFLSVWVVIKPILFNTMLFVLEANRINNQFSGCRCQ